MLAQDLALKEIDHSLRYYHHIRKNVLYVCIANQEVVALCSCCVPDVLISTAKTRLDECGVAQGVGYVPA